MKEGGTEKRGGDTKLKQGGGGKVGQEADALKKGGLEPPYKLWYIYIYICNIYI